MKHSITIILLCICTCVTAQIKYGTPTNEPLPEKLQNLKQAIQVNNFPKTVDAVKIKDDYYWKHTTSILCKDSAITILEYGAYLFYNNTWNLRKSYPLKTLDKSFGTKKQKLLQAQPYTWTNNWRVGNKLYGGWAMWYFIGKTATGELVCGYEKIHTTNTLLN